MSRFIVDADVKVSPYFLVIDTEKDEVICECLDEKDAEMIANSLNTTTQPTIKIDENEGWIKWEWTEEKPYPLDLNVKVDVLFGDGEVFIQDGDVDDWRGGLYNTDYWKKNTHAAISIIAYRPSSQSK